MEPIYDMIRAWDTHTQFWFGVTVLLAIFLIVQILCRTLVVLVRGRDIKDTLPDCNSDDNFTGKCLRREGPCRTVGECERVIESINQNEEDD